jgi:hypothetical protein
VVYKELRLPLVIDDEQLVDVWRIGVKLHADHKVFNGNNYTSHKSLSSVISGPL